MGATGPLLSALGAGQTGGNRLRDGSLEGARGSGEASDSSLSVVGAGSMGGVVEIDEDEDGEESSDDKVEVINEPPSAAAHPAPDPLERVIDTVSIRHF